MEEVVVVTSEALMKRWWRADGGDCGGVVVIE